MSLSILADVTVYVGFMGQIYVNKSQTYAVASALAVTDSVCMLKYRILFGTVYLVHVGPAVGSGDCPAVVSQVSGYKIKLSSFLP